MKIKEFFKKYANISSIMKIWEADITFEEVNEIFDKLDKDHNGKLQVKDLILAIIENNEKINVGVVNSTPPYFNKEV